jgi:hypothetical protein
VLPRPRLIEDLAHTLARHVAPALQCPSACDPTHVIVQLNPTFARRCRSRRRRRRLLAALYELSGAKASCLSGERRQGARRYCRFPRDGALSGPFRRERQRPRPERVLSRSTGSRSRRALGRHSASWPKATSTPRGAHFRGGLLPPPRSLTPPRRPLSDQRGHAGRGCGAAEIGPGAVAFACAVRAGAAAALMDEQAPAVGARMRGGGRRSES